MARKVALALLIVVAVTLLWEIVPSFVLYLVMPEAITVGILVGIGMTLGSRAGAGAWPTGTLSMGAAMWALALYHATAANGWPAHEAYILTALSTVFAAMTQLRARFV